MLNRIQFSSSQKFQIPLDDGRILEKNEDALVSKLEEFACFILTIANCDAKELPEVCIEEFEKIRVEFFRESNFSISRLFLLAKAIREHPFLLSFLKEKDFFSGELSVFFENGTSCVSFYKLLLLAVYSEFVLGQLESGEEVIHLPIVSEDVMEKMIACLQKGQDLTFEELVSIMDAARLVLDEKFFVLVDRALSEKLCSMQISKIYKEDTVHRQLMDLLSLFREHLDSFVHQEIRKIFTPLILEGIENRLLDEHLISLAPPLELKITPINAHLLNHPIVQNQMTHCVIDQGLREFYCSVLDNLPDNMFLNIRVESRFFLMMLPASYRDNKQVILASVKKNGQMLRYASDRWQNDWQIVQEAVREFGGALQFASDMFKDNEEIVREAILQDLKALEHASPRLREFFQRNKPQSNLIAKHPDHIL